MYWKHWYQVTSFSSVLLPSFLLSHNATYICVRKLLSLLRKIKRDEFSFTIRDIWAFCLFWGLLGLDLSISNTWHYISLFNRWYIGVNEDDGRRATARPPTEIYVPQEHLGWDDGTDTCHTQSQPHVIVYGIGQTIMMAATRLQHDAQVGLAKKIDARMLWGVRICVIGCHASLTFK